MQNITGDVVGKIQFKIDKPSWDNLDKFSKKLTAIKRQMSGLDKTIKVQQVVNQIKTVSDKINKASTDTTKKLNATAAKHTDGYNSHIVAYQKYQQQMNKMYDSAIAEDRRRENQKIKQAEKFHSQQLRSDLARDRAEARMRDQANRMNNTFDRGRSRGRDTNYEVKANRYIETKLLQARVAGVSDKEQRSLMATFSQLKGASAVSQDFAELKHRMQSVTKEMIAGSREARRNAVTFGSLRGELVQLTAAYTAFTVVQSIAKDGMELQGLRAAAKVFAGTEAGVADHMTFIANEAERLGTNLLVSTKEFTKFAIATKGKVSSQGGRDIFSGISEYAAVMQIDQQQFERAFKSVNQMLSKGQLMAEEVRSQMAESLYGSIPILAQAYGFSADQEGEAAFFKAMERGELKATEENFVKFAKGLSQVANANGALTDVTKKTRAEMNRFFNAIVKGKDEIFQSGMDDGLSYMFGTLSQTLEDLAPIAKAFGGAFKGALSTMTAALKIVLLPLEVFTKLLSGFDMSDRSSGWLWSVVGAGGSLFLLASGFNKVAIAVGAVNTGLLVMMGHILRLLIPALLLEDIVGSLMGKNSVLNVKGGVESVGTDFGATWWAAQNPMAYLGTKMFMGQNPFSVNVVVTPDGSEFGKAVKATVDNENQKQQATLSSEGGG